MGKEEEYVGKRVMVMDVRGMRTKPLARNGNFFKNAVIPKKIAVTSKTIQLHIFRGL